MRHLVDFFSTFRKICLFFLSLAFVFTGCIRDNTLPMDKEIETYLIDDQYRGWYDSGLDKNSESKKRNKADLWVVNYHTTRSLINCIEMLRREDGHK